MSEGFAEGERFELAVVGAGSAGFSAAITAAEAGAKVLMIGDGVVGGTCVNVGCVPSKALIRAVEPVHVAAAASRFDGIEASARVADWSAAVAQKQALVEALRQAKYVDVLGRHPRVRYAEGLARFGDDGALGVNGRRVAAGKVVLATGARPRRPDLPGLDAVDWLDSTGALELTALPPSLLVLGGGYVGVELAQMFARAGVRVTIAARRGLLPGAEPEIAAELSRCLSAEGIALRTGLDAYGRVSPCGEGVALDAVEGGAPARLTAARLLVATGRAPNVEALRLDTAGVATDAAGAIAVDARMRTSRDGVYAAGDVTGRDQFVYMAAHGGRIAALNALEGDRRAYDDSAIPAVVFTDPQAAHVGLTEAQARARGLDPIASVLPLSAVPRALAARDARGLIKLVAARADRRLLGAHVLAPEGADSVQTAAMAIRAGMTVDALAEAIFPYLTTVEGLKLAAQTFDRDVASLSCCAG